MKNIFTITFLQIVLTSSLLGQTCPAITLPIGTLGSASNSSQNLKQSNSWIKTTVGTNTSSRTISLASVVVRLDGHNVNGYVELNPGFEAFPTSTGAFIAQTLDGCGSGIPARTIENPKEIEEENASFIQTVTISPNPSNDIFNIKIDNIVDGTIEVYTIIGVLLLEKSFENNTVTQINLERFPSQTYIVKIKSGDDNYLASKQIIKY